MKAKIATVPSAGLDSGKMMFQKTRKLDAPSMLEASSSSLGMLMKNWRSRKIKKGQPNQAGTMSGRKLLTHPSSLKRMKRGTMVTSYGIIIVASTNRKRRSRPRARSRAKPKATSEQDSKLPRTLAPVTISEFLRNVLKGRVVQPCG